MSTTPQDNREQAFMESIRRRVCGVCIDARDDGSCGLTGRACAVEEHLPGVVAAITSTRSRRLDEYVEAIRAHVCSRCVHQDTGGHCTLRRAGECALETYLYLVVEAIEEVERPLLPELLGS